MRSAFLPPRASCRREALPTSRPSAARFARAWPGIFSMWERSEPSSATRSTTISSSPATRTLGRGQAAGLHLQDPEFGHRAGDRRGRRSRQGRLQVGRRRQKHRGLEQGPHHAHRDRGIRGAGLSGDRPAHRRGADAEICRSLRIRQPRYRRRHRPVLADRQFAHRSGAAGRFRRPAAARRACRSRNAARIWCAIYCRSRRSATPSSAPRAACWAPKPASRRWAGWWAGPRRASARTVFALNMDCLEPRHIADRMAITQQCLGDIGANLIRKVAEMSRDAGG